MMTTFTRWAMTALLLVAPTLSLAQSQSNPGELELSLLNQSQEAVFASLVEEQPTTLHTIRIPGCPEFLRVGNGAGRPVQEIEITVTLAATPGVDRSRLDTGNRECAVRLTLVDVFYIDDLGRRHNYASSSAQYRRPHQTMYRPVVLVALNSYQKPADAPFHILLSLYHPATVQEPNPREVRQFDIGNETVWVGRLPAQNP